MSTRPPVDDWTSDFDHLDPRWVENPYPIWESLRDTCPVAHTERYRGVYFPSRYEDVRAVAQMNGSLAIDSTTSKALATGTSDMLCAMIDTAMVRATRSNTTGFRSGS